MIISVVHHKVEDFAKWKSVFDDLSEVRKKAGEVSYSCGKVSGEPDKVYVINEWRSLDALMAFLESPALKEGMDIAGVMEAPHTLILEEVDKG